MKEGYFDIYEWLGNLGFSKELQAEFTYVDAQKLYDLLVKTYETGRAVDVLTKTYNLEELNSSIFSTVKKEAEYYVKNLGVLE